MLAKVPANHINIGLDADLVIYVTAKSEPAQSFLAWATSCSQDSVTKRPQAGQVNYNLYDLNLNNTDGSFEKQVDVTIHEVGRFFNIKFFLQKKKKKEKIIASYLYFFLANTRSRLQQWTVKNNIPFLYFSYLSILYS